jgi:hypothetical protein
MIQKSLELVCGRNLERFGEARKSLDCCEQSVMDDSCGSSEDQNTDRNADSKDCAHEISDEKEYSI